MIANPWIPCETELPPEDVVVEVQILGFRTPQHLRRCNGLWWHPLRRAYVDLKPAEFTHWRRIENERAEE